MSETLEEKISLEKVMENLNKEISQIKHKTMAGYIDAAIIIRRSMKYNPPKIPVDTGNLRASWFTSSITGTPTNVSNHNPDFKGKDAGKMADQHSKVVEEYSNKAFAAKEPTMYLGFSANYAAAVHESYGKHFRRPGAGAGFFVSAIRRNKDRIIEKIRKEAKIE